MGGGGFLGLGPAPKAPPPPDYAGAARETAQGNLAAAQSATAANRVNQITPYGNLNYAETGTDSRGNPIWTATTTLSDTGQQLLNNQNAASLGLGSAITSQLGQVQNVMGRGFNPNFDAQAYLRQNPDVAAAGVDPYQHYMNYGRSEGRQAPLSQAIQYGGQGPQLGQVGQGPQFSQAGQAQQAQGVGQAQQAQGIGSGEMAQRIGGGPQFQNLEAANALRRSGNTDALQRSLGQNVGMEGWDRASGLLMSRLTPQIEQSQDRLKAQLANQGIVAGTEAYNRAMTQQGQKENDLRTQAQLQAQGIQQNLFGQELQAGQFGNQAATQQQQNLLQNLGFSNQAQQQDFANRQAQLAFNNQLGQQGYQNQLAGVQANNQAIAQNFGQGLSAQQLQNQAAQQNFANQIAGTQIGNQAAQQNFANQLAGLGFNNQANQQGFANQLAAQQQQNQALQQMFANQQSGASLSNQAQQQAYNQALAQYNMPLNTLSALRTGAQVQNPSFVNAPQQATTSGADILGATQMGYNAQMGDFNAQNAAQQNFNSGLMGLGGAGIMAFSDIRMKENIKQIHWLPNGLPVYEFEYKPEFKDQAGHGKFVGVMAQEVEMVQPEAVITNADGYKMVNYGVLNG
jgi:hypothetical protein